MVGKSVNKMSEGVVFYLAENKNEKKPPFSEEGEGAE